MGERSFFGCVSRARLLCRWRLLFSCGLAFEGVVIAEQRKGTASATEDEPEMDAGDAEGAGVGNDAMVTDLGGSTGLGRGGFLLGQFGCYP